MSGSYPSLGIKVDFAEIQRLIGGLKQVQAEYVKTGQAARAASTTASAATGGNAAASAARATVAELSNLQNAVRRTEGFFHSFWGTLHRIRTTFYDVRTAIGLLLGAMVVAPIIRMADAMTALEARTRLYAASGAQVPTIMARLFTTAEEARTPLEGIAKLYTRLAPLSEQLGRSQGELIRVVGTVAKAFTLGGASAAEATASAQQFAQAISSNRFGGDELRSVAENAPALLQAIAEGVNQINPALNLNAATFIKWAQAGNATSEIMVKALENSRAKIDAMFASMPVTVDQSMTLLKNSITKAVGDIDKAFAAQNGGVKLSTEIALSISRLAKSISSPEFVKAASDGLNLLIDVFRALGRAIEFVSHGFIVLVAGITGAAAVGAATSIFTALSNSIRAVGLAQVVTTYQTMAATAASYALRTAWTALIAATPLIIIAALTASIMFVVDAFKKAEEATKAFNGELTNGATAINNAITLAKTYSQDTTDLSAALTVMTGTQQKANETVDDGATVARAMAEVQKQMAIAQLESARAALLQSAANLRNASSLKEYFGTVLRGASMVAGLGETFLAPFGLGGLAGQSRDGLRAMSDDLLSGAAEIERARTRYLAAAGDMGGAIASIRSMRFNPLSADGPVRASGGTSPGATAAGDDAAGERGAAKAVERVVREANALKTLVEPMKEYAKARAETLRLASMSTSEMDKETRALEISKVLLADNLTLTEATALAWGRIRAGAEQAQDRAAEMKKTMKDSIERAFVESGKLDFKGIREGMTRSIRQAVYDALIAEPIRIVVDAVVELVTDTMTRQIKELLAKFTGSRDADGNPSDVKTQLKAVMDKLPKEVSGAITKGMAIASGVVAGYQAGAAVADTFGLTGSNKDAGKSQKIMDWSSAAVGFLVGGPLGAALAVVITRVLGPAIIGKESNYGATANFSAGGTAYGLSGSKRTKDTTEAVTGIAESVMSVIQTLATMGIEAGDVIKNINIGTRDPTHIRLANGMDVRSAVGDPEAALKAASLALLQYGTYADARMKSLVDQMVAANQSFDAIVAKLDQYVVAQKVPKDLQTALLQYSNPRAYQLKLLQDQQIERRKTIQGYATSGFYSADQLSSINANLAALERSEITAVVEQFASSLTEAAHSLQDFKDAQQEIADFTRKLMTGSLSPLAPEDQLALERQGFITNLARAQGGNYGALTGITGDAQDYLTAAQKFYGSTQAYATIFKEVTDALTALSSQEIQDPMTSAIEQAAIDLQLALEAQTLAIVQAIQQLNDNTTDNLADLSEAVVLTNGGGLADIADSLTDQNLYNAALQGGVAA